jgi:hydroxypyruvate isomerase
VCVKCSEDHKTENCQKSKKSKAKCANCGEAHTANWKGCSAYKKAEEKAHPKKLSAVQRIQQKPTKTVTAAISYAQMTGSSNIDITPQTFNQQQQSNVNNNQTKSALTKITKSLENVTSRLDRLENIQSKSNNKNQKKKK